MVCSIILIIFVLEEYKISYRLGESENIFTVESDNTFYTEQNVRSSSTSTRTRLQIAQRFPEVVNWATVNDMKHELQFQDVKNMRGMDKGIFSVTPSFCEMFELQVIEGDLRKTISAVNEIAVTNDFMRRTFGRDAVLGDVLKASTRGGWINGEQRPIEQKEFTITTILAENIKTPLIYGALIKLPIESIANAPQFTTIGTYHSFIKLGTNVNIEAFIDKFTADTVVNYSKSKQFLIYSFSKILVG